MRPENIAYAAKVNAACWLILKARKIARRLDATSEQQQAIEDEIAEIGHRLYREAGQGTEPEVTHDPGEDHELAAYVAEVRTLNPCVERWFVDNDYKHGSTPEKTVERWREFLDYLERTEQR